MESNTRHDKQIWSTGLLRTLNHPEQTLQRQMKSVVARYSTESSAERTCVDDTIFLDVQSQNFAKKHFMDRSPYKLMWGEPPPRILYFLVEDALIHWFIDSLIHWIIESLNRCVHRYLCSEQQKVKMYVLGSK